MRESDALSRVGLALSQFLLLERKRHGQSTTIRQGGQEFGGHMATFLFLLEKQSPYIS